MQLPQIVALAGVSLVPAALLALLAAVVDHAAHAAGSQAHTGVTTTLIAEVA